MNRKDLSRGVGALRQWKELEGTFNVGLLWGRAFVQASPLLSAEGGILKKLIVLISPLVAVALWLPFRILTTSLPPMATTTTVRLSSMEWSPWFFLASRKIR